MQHSRALQWMLLVAATLLVCGCREKTPEKDAQPIRVVIVQASSSETGTRYSATVLPSAEVDLTFRVGGYVRSIHRRKDAQGNWRELAAGDVVPAGLELASIRPADYQSRTELLNGQLNQARSAKMAAQAHVDEATAAREQARLTFTRSQILFNHDAITKPEYDDARLALDRAEARLAATQSQLAGQQAHIDEAAAGLKEASSALADTRLLAPFTGVIVARKVELGSLAAPGTVAFVIANIEKVKVTFGVPDVALSAFRLGQPVPITTESAPDTVFHGRVSSISSSADSSNRAYPVEVSVDNPAGVLKAGMIAEVELKKTSPEPAAPQVPLSAVVHTAGMNGYGVFVIESRNGKSIVQLRTISLGQVNGRQVTVAQGLRSGEHVAQDGGLQLVSGEPVREIR